MERNRKKAGGNQGTILAASLAGVLVLALIAGVTVIGCGGGGGGSEPESFRKQIDDALKISDPAARAKKLVKISHAAHQAKASQYAEEAAREANSAGEQATDPIERAQSLADAGKALATVGRKGDAKKAASKAGEAAEKIENVSVRVRKIRAVAEAYAKADDAGTATAWLRKAQKAALAADSTDAKVDLLREVAAGFSAMKKSDEVKRVIEEMTITAEGETDPAKAAKALVDIAKALQKGKIDGAKETLERAVKKVDAIEKKALGVQRLCDIAEAFGELGDTARAKEVIESARQLAHKVPEPDAQKEALETVNDTSKKVNK